MSMYIFKKIHNNVFNNVGSYRRCNHTLRAQLDERASGLRNGIDSPEDQKKWEQQLNLNSGDLDYQSPIWDNQLSVTVQDTGITRLYSEIPIDAIRIEWMKRHSMIAFGRKDLQEKPKAEYLLIAPDEEVKEENKNFKQKRNAYKEFSMMSTSEMSDVLYAMGKNTTDMGTDAIENRLQTEIEVDPKKFLSIIQDPEYKYKVLVNKAVAKGVLKKKASKIYYDDEIIGHNLDSTVSYFADPKNQNILSSVMDLTDKQT